MPASLPPSLLLWVAGERLNYTERKESAAGGGGGAQMVAASQGAQSGCRLGGRHDGGGESSCGRCSQTEPHHASEGLPPLDFRCR